MIKCTNYTEITNSNRFECKIPQLDLLHYSLQEKLLLTNELGLIIIHHRATVITFTTFCSK